jgi:hypothetical protein
VSGHFLGHTYSDEQYLTALVATIRKKNVRVVLSMFSVSSNLSNMKAIHFEGSIYFITQAGAVAGSPHAMPTDNGLRLEDLRRIEHFGTER